VPLTNSDGQSITPPPNQRSRQVVKFLAGSSLQKLSRISFMTEESLIRLCSASPDLANVSVLMIDEAHERNLNTDIVLGIAKQLLARRKDFYVVVASATIDESKFLQHFGINSSHVLAVKGRTFPVSVEHVALPIPPKALLPAHVDMVDFLIGRLPTTKMHTLVFLPTQKDIEVCIQTFMSHPRRNPAWVALPLSGQLSSEDQQKAVRFDDDADNKGKRMVAFSTNVAETSLTLPGIKLVIDTGLQNCARFDPLRRLNVLELAHVSQASADQRKGRAGRVSAGHCVRLFDYTQCQPNSVPEILRLSLDLVCLRICSLPGQNPKAFPFIEPPPAATISASMKMLADMQCVDPVTYTITDKGRAFFALPFDPRWSEFVYTATRYDPGLREEAITVAALQCAPGNLFFFGKSAEDKKERKKMVASMCKDHQGDVRFLTSVYKAWQSKARVLEGSFKCSVCTKPTVRRACSCQKTFAVEQSLNQKVLDAVQNTVAHACHAWKLSDPPPEQRIVPVAQQASSLSRHSVFALVLLLSPMTCCFLFR
jgi:ATP-dependent RNA helicase DHX8/PRP22